MCALTTDGYKARNAFFKYEPSDRVKDIYAELDVLSWDLKDVQNEYKVDFPVHLCTGKVYKILGFTLLLYWLFNI